MLRVYFVRCSIFVANFNKFWFAAHFFQNSQQKEVSSNLAPGGGGERWYLRTDGQRGGRADMTKVIEALHYSAKVPKHILTDSNVCHPHCVCYNSKQLGMLTLTVKHNYICFYYKQFTTTTCFGPICGPSSGCG